MGIGEPVQAFVGAMLTQAGIKPGFSVVELGAQVWHVGRRRTIGWKEGPAAEFWREQGCGHYDCIDANGEGTIKADLNQMLPCSAYIPSAADPDSRDYGYDVVTDFGTGEHIFDQAQVFRTMHHLCKPGGLILRANPHCVYQDHGFYCYHPTLMKDVAAANGYALLHLEVIDKRMGQDLLVAFRKGEHKAFRVPVQGKYRETVKI